MDAPTIQDIHVGYTLKKDPKIFYRDDERNKIYNMGRNQKGYIWMMEHNLTTKSHNFHKILNEPEKQFTNYFSEFLTIVGMKATSDILHSARAKKFHYHLYGIRLTVELPNLPLPSNHKWYGLDDLFCFFLKQGYIYDDKTGTMYDDD
jgi:hypothetical protein